MLRISALPSGYPVTLDQANAQLRITDSRGDTFDYRVTSATAAPGAFDKILATSRAKHFWLGDTISNRRINGGRSWYDAVCESYQGAPQSGAEGADSGNPCEGW